MTKAKPEHHKVPIIRIEEVQTHPNADNLELIQIKGYQCVVKKGDFKVGDLGVYIYPDSVVPEISVFDFLWLPRTFEGPVPERYRRVTVRKFRGSWSEGLLLPLSSFSEELVHEPKMNYGWLKDGDDVSDLLGVYHYQPPEPGESSTCGRNPNKGVRPRSLMGWWYWLLTKLGFKPNGNLGGLNETASPTMPPVYDVDAFKNFKGVFEPGEQVVVTEKIHGSNARFTFQKGKMYAGSRQLWKKTETASIWWTAVKQLPWIEAWCHAHEGYALYGEVTPTQGEKYNYGCGQGDVKVFVFDILTPEGKWLEYEDAAQLSSDLNWVPLLYKGPFDEAIIKPLADGKSQVGGAAQLDREGCVIKPLKERHVHGLGRLQLKVVSNKFLEAQK